MKDTPLELIIDHVGLSMKHVGEDGASASAQFRRRTDSGKLENAAGLPKLVEIAHARVWRTADREDHLKAGCAFWKRRGAELIRSPRARCSTR